MLCGVVCSLLYVVVGGGGVNREEAKNECRALLTAMPYDYQLRTLAWMRGVESAVESDTHSWTIASDQHMQWAGVNTALRFDQLKTKIKLKRAQHKQSVIKVKGGVLADEVCVSYMGSALFIVALGLMCSLALFSQMGLGKTLTAISLILTSPPPTRTPEQSLYASPFTFTTNATLVVCPSHLVRLRACIPSLGCFLCVSLRATEPVHIR